jgi:hypothetical protein
MTAPVEQFIQEKTRDLMVRIGKDLATDVFCEFHLFGCHAITRHVWGGPGGDIQAREET